MFTRRVRKCKPIDVVFVLVSVEYSKVVNQITEGQETKLLLKEFMNYQNPPFPKDYDFW